MEKGYALAEELLYFIISAFLNTHVESISIKDNNVLCVKLENEEKQEIAIPEYRGKEIEEILSLFRDFKNKEKRVQKIEKHETRYRIIYEENGET